MSSSKVLDIAGIYPPIATPFNADESIAYDKLARNLGIWNNVPFRGYVVQGSNGEYVYLTPEERVEMVKQVRDQTPAGKLVIAGSGCEGTRATIEMTQHMAKAGADAAMVVTPCYYKGRMNNQALESHYIQVADHGGLPVVLYSVPGNTGIDLAPEVIVKLAQHPNIIGVKDSAGDVAKMASVVHQTKGMDFQVLAGSASFLYPALTVGCVGGVCALANILGKEVCDLASLHEENKHEEAKLLQHKLVAPNGAVTKKFGVSGLKLAMDWFNLYGGPVRAPLQPLNQQDAETVRQAFRTNGFQPTSNM